MLDHFLGGPILRRTTRNRICVWLALDKPFDLSLEILDVNEHLVGASKQEELPASRVQLGANLYIYLLCAYPIEQIPFITGTPLYYRLLNEQSHPIDLQAVGLTYEDHKHPIFHIPDTLVSVLHGSCRKPHGSKDIDTLSLGDDLLEKYYQKKLGNRPDVLLMTGDQIYADDVAASLLEVLQKQAGDLIGTEDYLPLQEFNDTVKTQKCLHIKLRTGVRKFLNGAMTLLGQKTPIPPEGPLLNPAKIPLGGRQSVLRMCEAGFTSTQAHNHLMSFGEFAAMYLFVFGNAKKWNTPKWTEIPDSHVPVPKKKKQDAIIDRSEAVEIFNKTLSKVRRLLANIPTYMILDDHDITDDWNITGHWYDKVHSSPLGRRIVSNALAAYWAFQGWGNDPDNFDADMIDSITLQLNKHDHDPNIGERYDLSTWKHRCWGFSIPTNPPIIAIDSRTQRQPDNAFYPPRLLDRYALDWLRVEWTKLKASKDFQSSDSNFPITQDTCPFFIATTPVIGYSPVENVVQLALWGIGYLEDLPAIRFLEKLFGVPGYLTGTGVDFLDAEAWTSNLDGFTDLMDTLLHKMEIRKCTFLSGDVHYSFSATARYNSSSPFSCEQKTLLCRQLNSSALRNKPNDKQSKALNDLEKRKEDHARNGNWWRFYASQWRLEHTFLQHTGENSQRIVSDCNLGQVLFENGEPRKHLLWISPDMSKEYIIPHFRAIDESIESTGKT
ncbi:hypothetical protein [Nitrosomonas supralitoralis]|uniref:PhoD-like phosphatase n=1 Tax=Nitrosomonas supralitoralis TaxID=2116706 RepID=A0A2P7NWF2_9PROT|nr:hypothetical protein [Nitrosomonas supralitoralis]PSJ17792.1 hypothetical protein C7H79_05940 [Nitrosomonas supralitoralis]